MSRRAITGKSTATERLQRLIEKAAARDLTVLIQGETGTGKELVAREIHEQGRAPNPFVAVNCAGLPESLVESELFGYDKGAFTGADGVRKGRFEQADTGTLFLDEIGEINLSVQAKLLRVIQERVIDRVGSQRPLPVDFLLITATNRNLEEMVAAGTFRSDLYYRLHVNLIRTVPLRERPDDIETLALHFVLNHGRRRSPAVQGISPEVLTLFRNYSWPGNVRELESVIQLSLDSKNRLVTMTDLPEGFCEKAIQGSLQPRSYDDAMNELSRQLCLWALTAAHGNRRQAARLLQKDHATFIRVAKAHGISPGEPSATPPRADESGVAGKTFTAG